MGLAKPNSSSTSKPLENIIQNASYGSKTQVNNNNEEMMHQLIGTVSNYQKINDRINLLEEKTKWNDNFFKSTAFLSKLVTFIIILLPIFQTVLVIWIFIKVYPNEEYTKLIKGIIGFVGLGSVIELILAPIKLNDISKRLEKLEEQKN